MRDAKRYELVTLWPDQLELKQVDGNGKEVLSRFNPYFVKLVVDRDFNERTTGLHLRTRDRDVVLGAFLNPDEKSSFAKAFGTALKRARAVVQRPCRASVKTGSLPPPRGPILAPS